MERKLLLRTHAVGHKPFTHSVNIVVPFEFLAGQLNIKRWLHIILRRQRLVAFFPAANVTDEAGNESPASARWAALHFPFREIGFGRMAFIVLGGIVHLLREVELNVGFIEAVGADQVPDLPVFQPIAVPFFDAARYTVSVDNEQRKLILHNQPKVQMLTAWQIFFAEKDRFELGADQDFRRFVGGNIMVSLANRQRQRIGEIQMNRHIFLLVVWVTFFCIRLRLPNVRVF